METRVNAVLVGLFVVLFTAVLVGVAFWLYAGGGEVHRYRRYVTYFDESVAGLNLNANVTYRGVRVGRVVDIGLAPDGSGRVRLVLSVDETVPVKRDTVAMLRMQGLTGLTSVELSGGSPTAPPPRLEGDEHPVIESRPSLVRRLDVAVTDLLANINGTAERINALLDADTRDALKNSLRHLESLARGLERELPAIAEAAGRHQEAADRVGRLAERLGATSERLDAVLADLAATSAATRDLAQRADAGLGEIAPEIQRLLAELSDASAQLARTAREIERHPESLLWGRLPEPPGPGE